MAAPAIAAAASALLGAVLLGDKAFWFDETFNVAFIELPWRDTLHIIRTTEPSQAVYLVVLKVWSGLVGTSDDALLRVPSVAFAAAASAALVALGRDLFDRTTGLLAGLLLATNAFAVSWSQQARTYTLAMLAGVVTTLLFVRALRSPTIAPWVVYGCAGAVSVWCHFYAGLVLTAHVVAFAALGPQRPPWRRLGASWCVIVAGLLPVAAYVVSGTRENVEWIPTPSPGVVWSSLYDPTGRNPLLVLAAAAGLAALVARRPAAERWKATLLAGWVVLPLFIGVVAAVIRPFLVPRYAIVIAPALALLAAVCARTLPTRAQRAAAVAALLVVAAVQTGVWYSRTPEDWRGAARYAAGAADGGAAVVVIPRSAKIPFQRYAPDVVLSSTPTGPEVVVLVLRGVNDPGRSDEAARDFFAGTPYAFEERRPFGDRIVAERWSTP